MSGKHQQQLQHQQEMNDDNAIIEYLPRTPDEQLRIGLQIVQKAYKEKADALVTEMDQVKQLVKDKQTEINEMRNAIASLRSELEKKVRQSW